MLNKKPKKKVSLPKTRTNQKALQILNSLRAERLQAASGNVSNHFPWYDKDKRSDMFGKKSKSK